MSRATKAVIDGKLGVNWAADQYSDAKVNIKGHNDIELQVHACVNYV